MTWIQAHPVSMQPWDDKTWKIPGGLPSNPKIAQALSVAPAMLRKTTRGLYPAPEAALAAMVEGAQVDYDTALRIESRYLARLVVDPVALGLGCAGGLDERLHLVRVLLARLAPLGLHPGGHVDPPRRDLRHGVADVLGGQSPRQDHPEAVGADEAITEGVESILDALGAALPMRRLSWHYRSLDERLIAFANAQVYDGSLVTFPGTGTSTESVVRHLLVEGHGIVAEGDAAVETTKAEVDAVVALVLEHARTTPDRSLGVIALGITHAARVEEALRRALASQRGDVLAFFDEDASEAFFVKNLERVQGDERDDIILTIGYGKTPHGRVLHRFGPLNTEGGERRLNVATTRARRAMTVVSSIAADDLDPSRLRARGAMMLRDFLAYAADPGHQSAAAAAGSIGSPSVVMGDLAQRLRAHGLVVHERVGSSADPVDLAVEDPEKPGRMLLAVESDGPEYAGMRTPRDRDRLRGEHLERLGWRHVRVWSTDVFRDPARDVSRILEAAGVREAPGD